jgi:hypothetical protein
MPDVAIPKILPVSIALNLDRIDVVVLLPAYNEA